MVIVKQDLLCNAVKDVTVIHARVAWSRLIMSMPWDPGFQQKDFHVSQ